MTNIHGINLRREVEHNEQVAFTGVYDVFSATIAAKYSRSLFLSGFGFAASYYGLPDIGFIAWTDMVQFVQRIRAVLPEHDLLVDIDDGYGDPEVAAHVLVCEFRVIEPKAVHHRRLQIVDVHAVLDDIEAELVRLAVRQAAL